MGGGGAAEAHIGHSLGLVSCVGLRAWVSCLVGLYSCTQVSPAPPNTPSHPREADQQLISALP
jgi:hypothetical protein